MTRPSDQERPEGSDAADAVSAGTSGGDGAPGGGQVIERYLKTLPNKPGVYRMLNADGEALYVGKAKNLKKRVAAYTRPDRQSVRIRRMIFETASMEFVTTGSEAEALLLESNLIKQLRPRYNILLRDDKSFPYILVTGDRDFPQVVKYRGTRNRKGDYFGPFASVWAVNDALNVLQKAFLLRTCTDAIFDSRTRPCLLHQIKRCSAPCVERISKDDYAELVGQARAFLTGESQAVQRNLAARMEAASEALAFEEAAAYRDRIRALTRIQAHQDINVRGLGDADVIAIYSDQGQTCVQVFFFRSGANFGNRSYFPSHAREETTEEVLEAFLGQFYAKTPPPKEVYLSNVIPNEALVSEALAVRAGRKVVVNVPQRGGKRKLIEHARLNAESALSRRMSESATQRKLLNGLAEVFEMEAAPERIEVYDNSHVSGARAVGGMVVAGPEGFRKNAYRKFNIKGARNTDAGEDGYEAGDDYAMMREVLTRRFSRALKEDPDRAAQGDGGQWPDLVLIDGGKGQLGVAMEVFKELGVNDVTLASVAKGPNRNAGREKIFLSSGKEKLLKPNDPVLYFIQRLRDEAHRFAIGSHRARRQQTVRKSMLDEVPGIGAKRKKALLLHFGSAKSVSQARPEDLEVVEGVSKAMARKIHDWFHPDE